MTSKTSWSSIRLRNFRAFEDTGQLDYAPITLFFGRNSSGKTSILRAPLLLKQMLQQMPDREPAFSGSLVDFGSYAETVFSGESSRDIKISATITLPDQDRFVMPQTGWELIGSELRDLQAGFVLSLDLHWNKTRARTVVRSIELRKDPLGDPLVQLVRTGLGKYRMIVGRNKAIRINSELVPQSLRYLALEGGDGVEEAYLYLFAFGLGNVIEQAMARLVHIGPLRDEPSRAYRTDQVGVPGARDTIDVLRSGGTEAAAIVKGLRALEMASDVKLDRLAPGYSAILLKEPQTGRMENLADVGFGASQVLPILTTLATASAGSTVLIEQPELHLHPRAQGNFADVLLDLGRAKKLGLVIETHSEHMLLRLRRRVAEGAVGSDHISTFFVEGGHVQRAEMDNYGGIATEAMPEGFFEEEWMDLVKLAEAAARREG